MQYYIPSQADFNVSFAKIKEACFSMVAQAPWRTVLRLGLFSRKESSFPWKGACFIVASEKEAMQTRRTAMTRQARKRVLRERETSLSYLRHDIKTVVAGTLYGNMI